MQTALEFLHNWYPADPALESRAIAIVARAERDPSLATSVGMVAEYALYRFRNGEDISPERKDLGIRLLASGPEDARSQVYFALGKPPTTAAYEDYRRDAVSALLRSNPPPGSIAGLIRALFHNGIEGVWPSGDAVIDLLDGLSPVTTSQILLGAVAGDTTGNAARLVGRFVESNAIKHDERLDAFEREYRSNGDQWAALEVVFSADPQE